MDKGGGQVPKLILRQLLCRLGDINTFLKQWHPINANLILMKCEFILKTSCINTASWIRSTIAILVHTYKLRGRTSWYMHCDYSTSRSRYSAYTEHGMSQNRIVWHWIWAIFTKLKGLANNNLVTSHQVSSCLQVFKSQWFSHPNLRAFNSPYPLHVNILSS